MIQEKSGFSIVEALLASSLLVMIVTALIGAIIYGRESTAVAGMRRRAVFFAEEGLEAARNIRDARFANLTDGVHGLAISGGEWFFSGTEDTVDIFTRKLNIVSLDANRKEIVSDVSWRETEQRSGLVSLVTRLTDWLGTGWISPALEAELNFPGNQNGLKVQVQIQGNFAYAVRNDGNPDFAVIDISNSQAPVLVSSLNLAGVPANLFVSGNYAYVASRNNNQELQIIDISNPNLPSLVGFFNAPGTADVRGVYAAGSTVYLVRDTSVSDEFLIINAANPNSPVLLGSLNLGATGYEVILLGNFAYVASGSNNQELQVVNVGNPNLPTLDGSLDLSGVSDAITVAGFNATIILGRVSGGLYIIDVANPVAPFLRASLNVGGSANDLALENSNKLAFLASNVLAREFQVIDISDQNAPTLLSFLDLPAVINGVAYDGARDRVYAVGNADNAEFMVIKPQ